MHKMTTAGRNLARTAAIAGALAAMLIALAITQAASAQNSDNTAPQYQSGQVNGDTITITYNEPLDEDSTPPATAFVVDHSDLDHTPSAVSVAGSTVVLTLPSAVGNMYTVGVTYSKPADASTDRTQDAAGNDAPSFSRKILNNNTPTGYDNPIAGFTLIDPSDQSVISAITDGVNIRLEDPDSGSFAIRVETADGSTEESVSISLTGYKSEWQVENNAPYSLYGKDGASLSGGTLPQGSYDLYAAGWVADYMSGNRMGEMKVSFTVEGYPNAPARGRPTITGTAKVGETLTAHTDRINDNNGLDNASFSYQWERAAVDIPGATGRTFSPTANQVNRPLRVRVSFNDHDGYPETRTSRTTALVQAADSGGDTDGEPAVQENPLKSFSIVDADNQNVLGTPRDRATIVLTGPGSGNFGIRANLKDNSTAGSVRIKLTGAKTVIKTENWAPYSLYGDDGSNLAGEALPAGDYTLKATAYADANVGGGSLGTLQASFTVAAAVNAPALTAATLDVPESHDGDNAFTFELRFSEEPKASFSYRTLRDHAFTVNGGSVVRTPRAEPPKNTRWTVHVQPDGNGDVSIILPPTTNCSENGAVCTGDGRMLSNRISLTVQGPSE